MLSFWIIAVYSAACGSGPACVHGNCTYGDGAYFCQCRRGWAGAACDAPRAGFLRIPASGRAASDRAVNYACLVNGTECTDSKKCNYYAGAYSCDACPDGFVSYDAECLPKSCFNSNDYNNQEASNPPCNGRGRCLLKDPGMAGLEASDYACDCYPIYRGALCQSCDDANAIAATNTPSRALPTCNARACQDADGVVCSGHGKCVLDVGLDRESYHYRCSCNSGYTRVGHKCVKTECVATVDGSPVVCGGFGECTEDKDNAGTFKCVCDKNAVKVGDFCTHSACTDASRSKICGGVGACVRDGAAYSCDCRGLATGSLCETCVDGKSAQVGSVCVPLGCLTSNKQDLCTPTGTCVKTDGAYHCRCPDMLVAVDGTCTSPACTDEELGLVCSGHGTCDTRDLTAIKCTCNQDYTYVAPGRCILSSLIDNSNKVCSGNGRIVISADTPSTMMCQCSSIYEGTKCETCSTATAQMVDNECIANKCIVPSTPNSRASNPVVCGATGQYTKFGDPSDPFVTCTPKDANSGEVSAYNGTFFAKPGCVRVSKIDKTRRFYCGFLEGLTNALQTSGPPTCTVPSDQSGAAETCTACPTNFHLVHLEDGTKTCMHESCHSGKSNSKMWYDYCGGIGDCVKKSDGSYGCDCGTNATWNDTLKACVAEACKLDPKLVGLPTSEYCAAPSSASLHCTVGRDATWQCECRGETYLTYNKTCILKSKSATPERQRARGLCGGPGAGYLDSTGSCVCNSGFLKIGDMCYSYDCLAVGVTPQSNNLNISTLVCSGKGTCIYNQLTGRYGCECNSGLESFGGYCTYPQCASKVFYNGEIKYVECQIYDGNVGKCNQTSKETSPSCKCRYPLRSVNGICVHISCLSYNNVYCGGDVLASCVKGSNSRYSCVCSEGYERGQSTWECIPSKCVYKTSLSDSAIACNGLGTCSGTGLLKNRECECDSDATKYTLRDVSGEMRNTCILNECVSSGANTDAPVICGGLGRCGSNGCVCDMGTELFGNTCAGANCFIYITGSNGRPTKSVCGGENVGVCTKIGSEGNRDDYVCKCKQPGSDTYMEVDKYCLPKRCVFQVPMMDGGSNIATMCGGSHFGTCIINLNNPDSSYCECKASRTDVVRINTGQCMAKTCVSTFASKETVECSGHGTCKKDNNNLYSCVCEAGYQTTAGNGDRYLCMPNVCVVSTTDPTTTCSGRGTCQFEPSPGRCACSVEYAGNSCNTCASGYQLHTDNRCYLSNCPSDNSCGVENGVSIGTCQFGGNSFNCVCVNSSFVVDSDSKKCRKSKCIWTDPYDRTEKTCYGMGTCNDNGESTGQCSCSSNTILVGTNICAYRECVSGEDNAQTICKGRGVCTEGATGKGMCQCDSSKYRTDKKSGQCFAKECFGAPENTLSDVCDGGGTCNESGETGSCECHAPNYKSLPGQNGCVPTNCVSPNNKICSGFGSCEKIGDTYRCVCADLYTLVDKECIPTPCLNSGRICNGGGACTGAGASATCICNHDWTIHEGLCYPAACVANGLICGGNGDCPLSDGGSCSCRSGYESTSEGLCISSRCVQRGADGTVQVCGGNGRCVSESGVEPSCVCNEGFSLTGDFVCGIPVSSNKSSAGTTTAIVVVVLLVLAAVAGFLVWWFVIRPRKASQKSFGSSRLRNLSRQLSSSSLLSADAPLLG
ncbi:Hypothetical protein GSB_153594 [Giardia duodenalis]|uniref:EGF-like domain-containing protein n=1 Tax=Giardia intestinalis TaxID=5741 RepID=V6TVH2_GIAIN|nr:Hypothetical protein GSB_153594 [Giardia intestinalis]